MDEEQLNFERGQRAKRLLEDDILVEMLKKIEDDCYKEIRATKLMDKEVREQAYLLLTTVDIFRAKLRAVHDTGVMAEVQMKRRGRPPKVV
jgi:oxalate decarboxylase/phosphoglucose isomerase-like protein (cupin superfamily)